MWVSGAGLSWGDPRWRSVALLPFFWSLFTRGSVPPSLPPQQKKKKELLNCSFTWSFRKSCELLRAGGRSLGFILVFFPYSSPIHKIYWQGWVTIFWMWSDPPLQSDRSWIHLSQDQMGPVSPGGGRVYVTISNSLLSSGHTVFSRASEVHEIMCG